MVNVESGKWIGHMSGVGAGIDSFFEYLLKTYIMFGNHEDLEMFQQAYDAIKKYLRKGSVGQEYAFMAFILQANRKF